MRALVFGAGGMLGRAIIEELAQRDSDVVGFDHRSVDISDWLRVSEVIGAWCEKHPGSVIFNAAGVLNTGVDPIRMVQANALGPQMIATAAGYYDTHVIHVSTDCVFSGGDDRWAVPRSGYTVNHVPSPNDLYGLTKLVGEVEASHVTNVRTSFVGPSHGLWAWVIAQADALARVEGWTKALWSGSTVWAVAESLVDLAELGPPCGIVHLATEKPITKYDAIRNIAFAEQVDLDVIEDHRVVIDRTLSPTYHLESLEAALERRHS